MGFRPPVYIFPFLKGDTHCEQEKEPKVRFR